MSDTPSGERLGPRMLSSASVPHVTIHKTRAGLSPTEWAATQDRSGRAADRGHSTTASTA